MSSDETDAHEPASETTDTQHYIVPQKVLERIPIEERDEFSQKLSSFGIRISQEEHYVGPLQPSREAERWEALVPGTAARNFDIYEKQQLQLMEAQNRFLAITEESARHDMEIRKQQQKDSVALTSSELKNNADEVK